MWCPILFTEKKRKVFAKWSQKMIILIKILRQEKRYGTKRLLAEFPNKTFATHKHCEASAAEDRWHRGTVNRQLASRRRKRKLIIKQKYSIISVTFCWFLCVKYFYNRLRFKVVIDISCRGTFFGRCVAYMYIGLPSREWTTPSNAIHNGKLDSINQRARTTHG